MKQTGNDPLLATKLHRPPLRNNVVPRPRLTAILNQALAHKLTLVTGPAGFGKTTLVREWVEHYHQPVAWFSLDEQDNSPVRFLQYLIRAFRAIDAELGTRSLALLHSGHRPRIPTVLTQVINDLAAIPGPRIIVLDDYHVIEEQEIHQALEFLLAHLPPQVPIVMASRSHPPLNLARLRGQGQLLELTSADLRFTAPEVEQFFKQVMQLDLSPGARTALEMRTEGWVAGLQLAGLSLQAQENNIAFISSLTGTDRYIGDYLFEEVFQGQPDEIQQFLLFTSVADNLCSELGDAILEKSGSQAILERLDRLQLFIIPLDNRRRWYRYHQLFVELLRHQLRLTYAEHIPILHRRASLWFEQQNRLEEAVRHGLLAEDFERTAGLIETAFRRTDWVGRDMHRLLGWFEALPEPVTQSRPELGLGYAWLLLEIYADQWDRIEAHLQRVENILAAPGAGTSFSDQDTRLLAQVDLLRANQARHAGKPERVIQLCQQALGRLPAGETYLRSGIMAHLASAYESLGHVTEAGQLYTDSIQLCRAANNTDGLLFAAARLIEVCHVSGQLRRAEQVFDQVRDYADTRTGPDMGLVYISIGEVYREQNRLEQARAFLEQGLELCRPFEAWRAGVTAGVTSLARVLAAGGQADKALETLMELKQSTWAASPSEQARLESVRSRLLLTQGNFKAAARWARRRGLSATDEVDYPREFDHLTLVRVLIAQARLEAEGIRPLRMAPDPLNAADSLLEQLHQSALLGGRMGRVIEIRMLQALTRASRQKTAEAVARMAELLDLAEPEGYVRLLVDEGLPLYRLLSQVLTKPIAPIPADYVQTLLATFPRAIMEPARRLPGSTLTDRELETLRLLASELSPEEIAEEMSVSVSTVRTYTKRIYSKLDAHSRAEAVYLAKELKLLKDNV